MDAMEPIRIESLAHGGDGVGHADDGRTVFVKGACTGDLVDVAVRADKGRYVLADLAEVLEPSPARVDPPCPYFGTCGGCQWQHVSYEEQIAAKQRTVADTMAHVGGLDPSVVASAVRAPAEYGYRNKVELSVDESGTRLVAGFLGAHGHEIVPVDQCLLLPDRSLKMPRQITGALRYLSRGGPTGVTRVAVRTARHTSDIEVALWSEPRGFPRKAAAKVLADASAATSVTRVLYKGPPKERRVARVEVLAGRGWWEERIGDHRFVVSAPSFFQVNTDAAAILTDVVLDAVSPSRDDLVVELYAGVGTFTVPFAKAAGQVIAVESSSSALRDLRRNLADAGLDAEVLGGDAARSLEELGDADVVVLDPPRSGLGAGVVQALAQVAPDRVVYVSCDPATFARDAAQLGDAGWALRRATPVDMFPQTYHVEVVALFTRA